MKKVLLGLLSMFLIMGTINAQTGKKALKEAKKKLSKYSEDPTGNAGMLTEGIALLNTAFESDEVSGEAKNYITQGRLYNEIANAEIKVKLLDAASVLGTPLAGIKAYESFQKAIEMGDKVKDALKGLMETEGHVNNIAITHFQTQDYANAYKNYATSLAISKTLTDAGKATIFDDEVKMGEQKFYTAATAYYGGMANEAMPILEELYANGTDQALVYEALYKAKLEKDPTAAVEVLEAGRTKLPEDSGLLFAEINHYLQAGNLDVLISKLEAAREKEPENMSVVTTMGSVYDQLNQKEREAGNLEKADEYLAKAKTAYEEVIAADPTNFDATYSLGALYYNKAASMTDKINELSNDFSPAGTKKYEELKGQMDSYFKEALPYFESADKINGEDMNTLIALKEIAARSNDFEKADEYKKRMAGLSGK